MICKCSERTLSIYTERFNNKIKLLRILAYIFLVVFSSMKISHADTNLEKLENCIFDYASLKKSQFSDSDIWNNCMNEIEIFLSNPNYDIKEGTTSREHWKQSMNVVRMIVKRNEKKSFLVYKLHGPIVGKWWAIKN